MVPTADNLILGLNAFHGDSAAVVLSDGGFRSGIEEERLNRVKHWAGFPAAAVHSVLADAGATLRDIGHVAISRDPKAHLLDKALFAFRRRPSFQALRARLQNHGRVGDLGSRLGTLDGGPFRGRIHNVEHHRAHLASAFFCSPFEEAACLTVDGFGDFLSSMSALGRGTRLEVLDEVMFPHSLGILYTAVTQFLGFPKYGDEYKVMGLAAYGEPRLLPAMREIVGLLDDGQFETNVDFFRHATDGVTMSWEGGEPTIGPLWSTRLEDRLGPAREPGADLTDRDRDVAASLQAIYEEAFFHRLAWLQKKTGLTALCLAGGCAMNSVANGKIFARTGFRDVFIQSAAGDAGTALGAALSVWHEVLGRPRGFVMEHSYFGPEYSEERLVDALREKVPGFDGSPGPSRCGDLIVHYVDDEAAARRPDGRGHRRRGHRRVVPGPNGVGAASTGQPLDPGRPPQCRHEGRPEYSYQAARDLPPLRTVGPGGARGRLLRGVVPRSLHDQGLPDSTFQAIRNSGGNPRGRHGSASDGLSAAESALLAANQGLRGEDRRAHAAEYVVQRERTHREHARGGSRLLPAHAHGSPGAGELGDRPCPARPSSASSRRRRAGARPRLNTTLWGMELGRLAEL